MQRLTPTASIIEKLASFPNEHMDAKDFENQILMKREWEGVPISKVYTERGMLSPEHGQIVSICSRIWNEKENKWDDRTFGFESWDGYEELPLKEKDKDLVIEFNEYLIDLFQNKRGSLGGYNINNFDIPYLYRRTLGLYSLAERILVFEDQHTDHFHSYLRYVYHDKR